MSTTKINWSDLHDSILCSIKLDWKNGEVRFELETNEAYVQSSRKAVIIGKELTFFECPRKEPWGQSMYINEAKCHKIDSTGQSLYLTIEMQSGDLLKLEAKIISLEVEDEFD